MPSRIFSQKMVSFTLEMTEQEAWALAQYLKRSHWGQYRANAVSDDDAYVMRDALFILSDALDEIGMSPR
jgi:hypothetical protein